MRALNDAFESKKKILKEVIMQLHRGASPQEVKKKFKQILEDTSSEDIAKIEQELVKDGMPREQLQKLCDVHLAVFSEQLEKQQLQTTPGHPLNILIEEHKILTQRAEKLGIVANLIEEACDIVYVGDALTELQHIVKDFTDAEKHCLREENVLFPSLEKHGITEPPAIMWMEHDQIREKKKQLRDLAEKWNTMSFQDFKTKLIETAKPLREILPNHFFKENNILFPAAMQTLTTNEWKEIRKEFDEIGYCSFTPKNSIMTVQVEKTEEQRSAPTNGSQDTLQFETGSLSRVEVEAILDTLPIDVSFIDKDDSVKYFNKAEKRIFVRTKSVIGRKVQQCHPQKSIDVVSKIIEAFKTGKKDTAEFWIPMGELLVHIRYFAVRDKNGKYLGTMEVTQNITDIRKIEGQKRLLDWKQ